MIRRSGRRDARPLAVAGAVAVLAAVAGVGTGGTGGSGAAATHPLPPVKVAQTSGGMVHPLELAVNALDVNGMPLVTTSGPTGYAPAQVRSYLSLTGTGTGQTIAIVTAYHDPNIAADLATFDTTFGLAAPASFKVVSQTGSTTSYPVVDAGWALETSLDVQWAHAIAPGAGILLVEATTSSFTNMDTAIAYAANQTAVTVISNSWGSAEFNGETTIDSYCKLSGKLCVFSSGDSGNPATYPAFSPYVLAVGGTTLQLSSTGAVLGETAWSGSGGGVSLYEAKPSYQTTGNTTTKRGVADVSYDADPATGFSVYDSVVYQGQSGWYQMGGTSAGAPQWSAVVAVADQLRKAAGKTVLSAYASNIFQAHKAIYGATTGLFDITSGTNGTCGTICTAAAGYDFVTGRGSPRPGIDISLKNAT